MLDASADKSVACVSVSREVFGKETVPKHNRLIGLPISPFLVRINTEITCHRPTNEIVRRLILLPR